MTFPFFMVVRVQLLHHIHMVYLFSSREKRSTEMRLELL